MRESSPKSNSGSSKPSTHFPLIPKEPYESLPEEVKVNMRQQHAYYLEKYGRGGGNPHAARCPQASNHQFINTATPCISPEDKYIPSSDEVQECHDPINDDTQYNDLDGDPVMTFCNHQWAMLSQHNYITCKTLCACY